MEIVNKVSEILDQNIRVARVKNCWITPIGQVFLEFLERKLFLENFKMNWTQLLQWASYDYKWMGREHFRQQKDLKRGTLRLNRDFKNT